MSFNTSQTGYVAADPCYADSLLYFNSPYFRWETEVRYLIEQIEQIEPCEGTLEHIIQIRNAFNAYLSSNKEQDDLILLDTIIKVIAQDVRDNQSLKSSVEAIDILKVLGSILSVIGLVYLAYHAIQNKEKNRSLFFPSALEKKFNALDDKIENVPQKPEVITRPRPDGAYVKAPGF